MTPGEAMVARVYQILTDRYGPSYRWQYEGSRLPEGLRLEIHPLTGNLLMQDPELWERDTWDVYHPPGLAEMFRCPVKVTPDAPAGGWRLVIVTEELIDGGTLDDPVRT